MAGLTKVHVVAMVIFCIALVFCVRLYDDRGLHEREFKIQEDAGFKGAGPLQDTYFNVAKLISQRNNLSRMLNLKQQKIGQLECENLEHKAGKKVASSGGWCAQTSVENSGEHKTDEKLIPFLSEFFKDMHVGSFGDGPGRYKQRLLATGKLKGYDAYDGGPFSKKTSEGRVEFLDLSLPQYGLPMYDWIMSLEVAEHIPKEFESVYIDNIVRHAKYGVVLSWAIPGQVGYSHINNRPLEYVKQVFEKQGFEHDPEASRKMQKAASFAWLIQNTNVYRRKDLSNTEHLETVFT